MLDFFQGPDYYLHERQRALNKILNDAYKGLPQERYNLAALFTLNQLEQLLRTENFVQDGAMILISSPQHVTALFKEGNNFYYYDPNSPDGECVFATTDEVAKRIFYVFYQCHTTNHYNTPSPLTFEIFSFDKQKPYPDKKKLLEDIKPALTTGEVGFALEDSLDSGAKDGVLTGLEVALENNDFDTVNYYFEKDPNSFNKKVYGKPWFIYAYENGCQINMEALLKNPNFDPNSTDDYGNNLLMLATSKNDYHTVELLLTHPKTNVNFTDKEGDTPLIVTIRNGNYDLASLFLSKEQTDPNIFDKAGYSALTTVIFKNEKFVQLLLSDKRTDPDIANKDGETAFMAALYRGDINDATIELLLSDKRIDPNLANKDGYTSLMLALSSGSQNIFHVKLLLSDERTDPNCVNKFGNTALMIALYYNNDSAIKLLLANKRIDPNFADKNGDTVLMKVLGSGVIMKDKTQHYGYSISLILDDPRIDLNKRNNIGENVLDIITRPGVIDCRKRPAKHI